ncbi:MAG: SpoIID/LytB domain-containing protein [Thermoanaerobaculia bacterium]|nr:SpoIID/LytB domain-containing protein [Thermoanaerobaculia bacterium]
MNRSTLLVFLIVLAACATTTPPETVSMPAEEPSEAFETWTGEVPIPEPTRIRVGLASDLQEIVFPRIEGGYVFLSSEGAPRHTHRGFRLIAPRPEAAVEWGVRIASLADRKSAESLAGELEAADHVSLVVIDAGSGLHQVYAGRFGERSEASLLKEALILDGYPADALVAKLPSPIEFERTILLVDDEGAELELSTGSLIVVPSSETTIPIRGTTYRGAAMAHLNDRGLLNAINVLNLEDYVKGVVPNELGPAVYDQLEALKAQAMAARTYAIKRRGDYEREGYDICPTPACQVYKGFETEHELSNRAVDETAGMILTWNGEPIDALYTSTCGGETSDVSTMFPGRDDPYLKSVRCVESDFFELFGRRDSEILSSTELFASLFRAVTDLPDDQRWTAAAAERSTAAAAAGAGVVIPPGTSLGSLNRGPVLEYLGTALRFYELQQHLLLPEDVEYFFPESSDGLAARSAGFINKYRIGPAQLLDPASLREPMTRDELQSILYGWLEQQAAVLVARGKVAGVTEGAIEIVAEGKKRAFSVPEETRLYRSISDQTREREVVRVLPSDRTRIVHDREDRIHAVIVDANYDGAAFDRTSSYSSWIRSYTADQLADSIRQRRPISSVHDLVPLSRDEASRIEVLEVVSKDGTRMQIEGIPVRWSLGVPDNLFSFLRTEDPDGTARFTFWGKGWGHGTGMCQVGAFGMAVRGYSAEEIVKHFYTGIEIGQVE